MSDFGRLEVVAGDAIFDAWTSASVSKTLDDFAPEFDLSFARTGDDPVLEILPEGSELSLLVDGRQVLRGHVEDTANEYDGSSSSITVSGRDIVADLVDCSAINIPGQWRGARAASIASDLISPFPKLRFRDDLTDVSLPSVPEFKLQNGQSVYRALETLGRMLGYLLRPDADGGVYFTTPGRARAPLILEQGRNIERGRIQSSTRNRFSRYVFQGQNTAPEGWTSELGASVQGEAEDLAVGRPRPLLKQGEKSATSGELEVRARFEASIRAARARRVTYELPGWTLENYFWNPGDLVPVFDPELGIGAAGDSPIDLLLVGVTWSTGANAPTTAKVSLAWPGAYATLPIEEPTPGGEFWLPQTD